MDCKSIRYFLRRFESYFFHYSFTTPWNINQKISMSLFYNESVKIGFLLLFSIILAFAILFLSYTFSTSNPDVEKVSAYECGFDPYEDARNVFDVRFYLVALWFIIFDLEAVYFFPWCVSFSLLNTEGLWSMMDFIVELLIGFIYAWKAGALNWD